MISAKIKNVSIFTSRSSINLSLPARFQRSNPSLPSHDLHRERSSRPSDPPQSQALADRLGPEAPAADQSRVEYLDRKSTRLNSSHVKISYAVFCLKKKRT